MAANRVRLVYTGPEERADSGFLEEARRANPNGVIGRRWSAALFVSDLVETADDYILNRPEFDSAMLEVVRRMLEETGAPLVEESRLLLGLEHARRSCLQPLVDRGLLSYDVVGTEFSAAYERLSGKALSAEAGYFGSGIHVAHALDATLVPSWPGGSEFVERWIPPMRLMGDRLNFYRSANARVAASWAANERRREERRIILPPIPVLEMRADVAISDILRFTSVDRRKGRALVTRLSEMPESMRQGELERLVAELSCFEAGRATAKRRILALDTAASLPSTEAARLAELDRRKKDTQLQAHLERHPIARAKIKGVGEGRKATLASFNVEDAADVTWEKVRRVPGFGDGLTRTMVDWRQTIERKFVFNPALPTDPVAIGRVKADVAKRRGEIEQALSRGPVDLQQIAAHSLSLRTTLGAPLMEAYRALKQAELDASG